MKRIDHKHRTLTNDLVIHIKAGTRYDSVLDATQRIVLERTLEDFRGNNSNAAEALGISRGGLRALLIRYFGSKYFRNNPINL